jgi:hypothetical protein
MPNVADERRLASFRLADFVTRAVLPVQVDNILVAIRLYIGFRRWEMDWMTNSVYTESAQNGPCRVSYTC